MSEITISKIGFCKYRFNNGTPENWTVPVDIQEGRGVQFWFTYSWKNSRTCEINNIKPLLSQIEISNLIYIIEGIRYKVSPNEIKSLLIK